LYLFCWWTTRIQDNFFHCLKTLVFMVKRYSILFFLFVKLSCCYLHIFFIQFTQSAMFEKKLNIPAPYISDQFYYYRSDLPTLLSTFSKISQNFRHFPRHFFPDKVVPNTMTIRRRHATHKCPIYSFQNLYIHILKVV